MAAIFALALAVRLLHIWQIRDAPFFAVLMGDSRAYDEWAQRIAAGDWLGTGVFYQTPLYPYLLGTLYTIAERDLLLVRICQAIVGSLSCVLLALAGWRLFSRPVGIAAGVGLALYAPAIFFDGLLQKSVLDVFFLCLAIWLLSGLVGSAPRRRSWFWLGLAMGALSLTRENALALAAVVLLWALARPAAWRERAATAAAFLAGVSIVLAPVVVRNSVVGGGLYLTTSQFGPNFYIGNNARADGTYMSLRFGRGAPEYEREDATELAERATGRRLTPREVSAFWTRRALAFIGSEPAAWLQLLGRKTALLWNRSEMLDTESQESHAEWSMPLRVAGRLGHFGVLVPLALLGVIVTWPSRRRLWVVYGISAAYALSVVMFYVFARYRYPLVPFLMIFAAAGLVAVPRLRLTPLRSSAIAVVVAVVAVLVNRPLLSGDLMRAITEHNLAAALQSNGRPDEAIAHYRRAVALRADYAPAYNNMGVALRATGRLPDAVATYERALQLRPDYAEAHYNLANLLVDLGRPDAAIDHFEKALESRAGSADVHNNMGIALAAAGRTDEAAAQFREALRFEPDSPDAHRNLGNVLATQRMYRDAIAHLRLAAQLGPRDGAAHYDLGTVLLETGAAAEAGDHFRMALQLMPDSAEAHNNLGIALASQGRLDEAADAFQHALRLQPAFVDAQRNLAQLRGLRPR